MSRKYNLSAAPRKGAPDCYRAPKSVGAPEHYRAPKRLGALDTYRAPNPLGEGGPDIARPEHYRAARTPDRRGCAA